ncbi:MAG: T9SS type A sorting domain-containing protein, partial [Vicingaceae bacterium]|nr:T9SS type A sorting domain-containing protein [Vicingaceae bacterium]
WSNGDTTQTSWLFTPGTISVTKTDTALGCTASDSAIFTDQPIFTLGPDFSSCGLTSVDLTSDVDVNVVQTYTWNDASTNDSLNITTTGGYYLTITDTAGCMGTDSVVVTFTAAGSVDLGADTTVCDDAGFVLDAGTATSYLWSDASTNQTLALSTIGSGTYSVGIVDANGCIASDTIDVTVQSCVGVEEFGADANVSLYPNPTTGNITVSLKEFGTDVTLTVMNVYGQVVRSERVTTETVNLDLTNLSEGTYLLRLQSEESISVNKFIINR